MSYVAVSWLATASAEALRTFTGFTGVIGYRCSSHTPPPTPPPHALLILIVRLSVCWPHWLFHDFSSPAPRPPPAGSLSHSLTLVSCSHRVAWRLPSSAGVGVGGRRQPESRGVGGTGGRQQGPGGVLGGPAGPRGFTHKDLSPLVSPPDLQEILVHDHCQRSPCLYPPGLPRMYTLKR